MGAIVDALVADGANEREVELAVWGLIQARHLTPHGFVCRTVRSANGGESRTYEFVLIPWSPALDDQLELDLGQGHDQGQGQAGAAGV